MSLSQVNSKELAKTLSVGNNEGKIKSLSEGYFPEEGKCKLKLS